ncbi:Uncharacterized protein BP5553_08005 [Venustampulla echinocandica]|uniref:rRNA-processing protein FYV7 n=1 Tax=Venustampulla echinocandica TaxID=2656787 RepID=A0A370TFG2_9HELO|nr:Uncharacterized protein BP5553_08005 [Venustampulla echinocandica]RDL33637.1 Uncharacterized protein BP5553_08005 [Venustampulla echinocandica]
MSSKRGLEGDDATAPSPKKHRSGFKIGPDNLPDGVHRRKVIKIKKDLIHKAKVKKAYAKIKAQEPMLETPAVTLPLPEPAPLELHPERQAMLDALREPTPPPDQRPRQAQQKRATRRPAYFEKQEAEAAQRKAEAEERRAEFERRQNEKATKIEERDRFRKAMAKARVGGRNGQRKLGRESQVLLEKVRRVVGE